MHYYGRSESSFVGRSTTANADDRLAKVTRVLDQLRALPFDVDVRVHGLPGSALVDVDVDLTGVADTRHLVYAALESMVAAVDDYDYLLCIEDDILIDADAVQRMIRFSESARVNEILLPNRLEVGELDVTYCVDLVAMPGWRPLRRRFEGHELGVAVNPHSGLAFLSRAQARYADRRVDLGRRQEYHGGMMASAFANIHEPFLLWRTTDLDAHHVIHLDHWRSGDGIAIREPVRRVRSTGRSAEGRLDEVIVEGDQVEVRGWAADPAGRAVLPQDVVLGDTPVANAIFESAQRPDIALTFAQVKPDAGFSVRFDLRDLVPEQRTAERVAVLAGKVELSGDWPAGPVAWSYANIQQVG